MEINKIYNEDCMITLKKMPDSFIDCIVTSPPYFGLRDYGTATWEGGSDQCDHSYQKGGRNPETSSKQLSNKGTVFSQYENTCKKCGAVRIDKQIGLEENPLEYVEKLKLLFRECKRVLKDTGTLWLNLGDTYNGNKQGNTETNKNPSVVTDSFNKKIFKGLKPKDLIGIPWRVAFALQDDGWYLRQDIIWAKGNPMPESVKDRSVKSHEYIFLLAKSQKYYYDIESVMEEAIGCPGGGGIKIHNSGSQGKHGKTSVFNTKTKGFDFRNKRSVWNVNTQPFPEAHFAVYPEKLIEPCILAGCPEGGIIYDPFGGSGTTGLVAKKNNRNYILSELNPEYISIAEKRISNYENKNLFRKLEKTIEKKKGNLF